MIKKALLAGALGLALTTVGAVTAHAQKADEVFRYHDEFTVQEEFLSELCGFYVEVSVDARGTVRHFYSDVHRIHATEHGTVVLSANGKTLTQTWAGLFKGQHTEVVDEEAGTATIVFDNTNRGKHEKWTGDDGGVLIMDRGQAHFVGTVVIDLETGEPISLEEQISTNGPHPILEQGGLDPSLACEYFAG